MNDSSRRLSVAFATSKPATVARILDQLPERDVAAFFEDLDDEICAPILSYQQPTKAVACFELLPASKAAAIMGKMSLHARTVLLRALSQSALNVILTELPQRTARTYRRHLAYDLNAVGAWMETPANVFLATDTVSDSLQRLRGMGSRAGPIAYVRGQEREFIGVTGVDRILAAGDTQTLGEISETKVRTLSPHASLNAVATYSDWRHALELPVVDRNRRLLGYLSYATLRSGLAADRSKPTNLRVGSLIMHLGEAYLMTLSGLLHAVTTEGKIDASARDWGKQNDG